MANIQIYGRLPGGGGSSNYNELSNKPQINGVELTGNKTSADLGISGGSKIFYINQALASENWEENQTISAYILKDTATEVKQELERVATALGQELYVPIGRKIDGEISSITILSTWDIVYTNIEDGIEKMKRITFINTNPGEEETSQYMILYIEENEEMPELNGKWMAYAVME